MDDETRLTVRVEGRVQGVGMRAWIADRAREHGLSGSASNLEDGAVEVVAQGPRRACEGLLRALDDDPPGRVTALQPRWDAPEDVPDGFRAT